VGGRQGIGGDGCPGTQPQQRGIQPGEHRESHREQQEQATTRDAARGVGGPGPPVNRGGRRGAHSSQYPGSLHGRRGSRSRIPGDPGHSRDALGDRRPMGPGRWPPVWSPARHTPGRRDVRRLGFVPDGGSPTAGSSTRGGSVLWLIETRSPRTLGWNEPHRRSRIGAVASVGRCAHEVRDRLGAPSSRRAS
jgi:hypothetical protein